MEPNDHVCFVCAGTEGELHQVCNCNFLVHSVCIDRVITSVMSHATHCPTCAHAYKCRTRRSVRFAQPLIIPVFDICNVVVIVYGIMFHMHNPNVWGCYTNSFVVFYKCYAPACILTLAITLLCMSLLFRALHQSWGWVETVKTSSVVCDNVRVAF